MSNPSQLTSLPARGAKRTNYTVILSHDLDNYTFLPLNVRRDLSLGNIKTFYVDPKAMLEDQPSTGDLDVGVPGSRIASGTMFSIMLGRETKGVYCSAATIIASRFLKDYDPELDHLDVIQLIPDFEAYRQFNLILDKITPSHLRKLYSSAPNNAIAEHISENAFIDLCGVIIGMAHLRNNPLVDHDGIITPLLQRDGPIIYDFLGKCRVNYAFLKIADLMSPLQEVYNLTK